MKYMQYYYFDTILFILIFAHAHCPATFHPPFSLSGSAFALISLLLVIFRVTALCFFEELKEHFCLYFSANVMLNWKNLLHDTETELSEIIFLDMC